MGWSVCHAEGGVQDMTVHLAVFDVFLQVEQTVIDVMCIAVLCCAVLSHLWALCIHVPVPVPTVPPVRSDVTRSHARGQGQANQGRSGSILQTTRGSTYLLPMVGDCECCEARGSQEKGYGPGQVKK